MKKNILIWGTALVLVVIAILVTGNRKPGAGSVSAASAPLPGQSDASLIDAKFRQKENDFTLTDLAGNRVSLKNLRGKDVYLNFWTTWCPWCKEELPALEKVSREYKNKDLVVLAVDIGEDQKTVSDYIRQNGYDFSVLLDANQAVAQQYGVTSIPVSLFIDKKGNIAKKNVGAMTESQMRQIIDALDRSDRT